MPAQGWPVSIVHGGIGVRPLRLRDAVTWSELRVRNEQWLAPWEGRQPHLPPTAWEERHSAGSFAGMLRALRREARLGLSLPFAVTHDGELVGQVTVSNITRGASQSSTVGYWIDKEHAGQGVIPMALAMALDHGFGPAALHRVEANVRPENAASLHVVRKLGFREEGLRSRLMFIDGAWRDHVSFALTAEDQPEGVLKRFLSSVGDRQ